MGYPNTHRISHDALYLSGSAATTSDIAYFGQETLRESFQLDDGGLRIVDGFAVC